MVSHTATALEMIEHSPAQVQTLSLINDESSHSDTYHFDSNFNPCWQCSFGLITLAF